MTVRNLALSPQTWDLQIVNGNLALVSDATAIVQVAICDPSRPFAPIARVAARRRMGKSC